MIEQQERKIRRDGGLFLLGCTGIFLVEFVAPSGLAGTEESVIHGFLFGCSLSIMLSGIFRATSRQALYSTIALGIGFALGAIIELF